MSVINQMLKDLELRRTADTSSHGLLSGNDIHGRSQPNRKQLLLSILIALLALSLAYLLWERFNKSPQPAPTSTNAAEAAPVPAQIKTTSSTPAAETPTADKPQLSPVQVKPNPRPTSGSKTALPTEITDGTPAPTLNTITPTTVTGSWQPRTFILSGSRLPITPRIKVSWNDGEKILSPAQVLRRDDEHLEITLTTGIDPDTWTVTLLNNDADPQHFQVLPPSVSVPPDTGRIEKRIDVEETPKADIEKHIHPLRPAQHAEQLYRQGYRSLQNGDYTGAEKQWHQAVRIDPTHIRSREGLAGLYFNHGRSVEANEILKEGLKHHPGHGPFATLYARSQIQNGQLEAATNTLEVAMAVQPQSADFHAFLAALYQRQEAFDKSVAAYRQALQQQPGQSIWWIGIGISYEGVGKAEEAANAYNNAIKIGSLPQNLRHYATSRLEALK